MKTIRLMNEFRNGKYDTMADNKFVEHMIHICIRHLSLKKYELNLPKNAEIIVLKLPTWRGLKPIKAFLIRMYELPQTIESTTK